MQTGEPSRTAWAAAVHRAAHQLLEGGRIFADPLAVPILGVDPAEIARDAEEDPERRKMRMFIAVRTRFAEDSLAEAVACGVRQLVVLGAGLDTYGYRGALRDRLRIFEVDHPATQAWKRERLNSAGLAQPTSLVYAAIDFERETLTEGLQAAGFRRDEQAFFTWLGVVPYLTEEAICSTIEFIAALPAGTQLVFDYSNPPESLSPESRKQHEMRAARVAAVGEAWITFFDTEELHLKLSSLGFGDVEDLGPREIAAQYFPAYAAQEKGGHILHASTVERLR